MSTTTIRSSNTAPDVPPPPTTFVFPLPVELVSNVLKHLEDTDTLKAASFVSKQWYSAAFPLIHYELWEPCLGPRHLARRKRLLQDYPHIAAAIRHIQPPRPLSEEEFRDDLTKNALEFDWEEEFPDPPYPFEDQDPTDPIAAFFARTARMALEIQATLMLEKEGGESWRRHRHQRIEAAFFGLIQSLPAVKAVRIWWFQRRVKAEDMEDARLSYIEEVELFDCSPRFVASLKKHWRFSRARFIIDDS